MRPLIARLALLLLAACCVGGHLHQVLGRFELHHHEGWESASLEQAHDHHDDEDDHDDHGGPGHQGPSDSGATHVLMDHQAAAEAYAEFFFVPLSGPGVRTADETAERLPEAQPQAITHPPRRS